MYGKTPYVSTIINWIIFTMVGKMNMITIMTAWAMIHQSTALSIAIVHHLTEDTGWKQGIERLPNTPEQNCQMTARSPKPTVSHFGCCGCSGPVPALCGQSTGPPPDQKASPKKDFRRTREEGSHRQVSNADKAIPRIVTYEGD